MRLGLASVCALKSNTPRFETGLGQGSCRDDLLCASSQLSLQIRRSGLQQPEPARALGWEGAGGRKTHLAGNCAPLRQTITLLRICEPPRFKQTVWGALIKSYLLLWLRLRILRHIKQNLLSKDKRKWLSFARQC